MASGGVRHPALLVLAVVLIFALVAWDLYEMKWS